MKFEQIMTNKNILIVEDERLIAESIKKNLEEYDYNVPDIVSTGEKAIEKVLELKPDLILMDIMLKDQIDGIEATHRIQQVIDIPIIYITAFTSKKILERAKETEPYGYITKPARGRELHAMIEMALHKHKMKKKRRKKIKN